MLNTPNAEEEPRELTKEDFADECPDCGGTGGICGSSRSCLRCAGTGILIGKEIAVCEDVTTVKELLKAKEDFEIELWKHIGNKITQFKKETGITIHEIEVSFTDQTRLRWEVDEVNISLDLRAGQ